MAMQSFSSQLSALNASLDGLTSDLKDNHLPRRARIAHFPEKQPSKKPKDAPLERDSRVLPHPDDDVELEAKSGLRAAVVRSDGTATAWYNARRVAVTVTRVGDRWSIFGAHPDGGMALNFDVDGTGCVNHPPPSTSTFISLSADGSGRICNARGDVQRSWNSSGASTCATSAPLPPRGVYGRKLNKHLGVRFSLASRRLEVFFLYKGAHACFTRGPNSAASAFSLAPGTDLFGRPRKSVSSALSGADDESDEGASVPDDMTVAEALDGMLRATNEAAALLSRAGERRKAAKPERRALHQPRERRRLRK